MNGTEQSCLQAHDLAEPLTLPARHLDLSVAGHPDEQPFARPRLNLFHATPLDDVLPTRPKENLRIETLIEIVQRPREQRPMLIEVDAGVVSLSFEEANLAHLHEPAALAFPQQHLVGLAETTR